MSQFARQPWTDTAADSAGVLAFLSEIAQHLQFIADFHRGDFNWQFWRGFDRPFETSLMRFSTDDGAIVAIGWFDAPDELELSIHPKYAGKPEFATLANMIIDWAEETYAATAKPDDDPLAFTVLDKYTAVQDILSSRGYQSTGEPWLAANQQSLDCEVPPPTLPDGFSIVPMNEGADFAERVDLHREVWNPSKLGLEGYLQLRTAPDYDAGLDLVVQAPDGRYVSYVHGWFDPVAKIGLLEPVGCREAYRGRGLTGSLIREMLHRFKQRGATTAWVASEPSEVPATALYRSTGFIEIARWEKWTKPKL